MLDLARCRRSGQCRQIPLSMATLMHTDRQTAHRPAGACERCRRIKIRCVYAPPNRTECQSCSKGGYDCIFLSRAQRTARKRQRSRRHTESRPDPENETSLIQDVSVLEAESFGSSPAQGEAAALPSRSHNLFCAADVPELDDGVSTELMESCQELLRKNLWPFSPVHWPSFQKKLANGTVEKSLYYALLASAVRAAPSDLIARFGSFEAASSFFAAKARRCVQESLDKPSLADAQALLLIILIDWGTSHGTRAFMYLGLAARIALTFLPEADHRLNHDFLAAETARRTIWMVFMVEQFMCSGNGRIPAVRAHELCISLPCSEMDYTFATPTVVPMFDGAMPPHSDRTTATIGPVGELGFMIQISRIWNLVATCGFKYELTDLAPQLQQLEQTLFDWKRSLPAQYADKPGHLELHVSLGSGLSFGFAQCTYYCSLVCIQREKLYIHSHRNELASNCTNVTDTLLVSDVQDRDHAIETIFSSADRIIEMLNVLELSATNGNTLIFPLFMLYACFTASTAIAYISIKQWTALRHASLRIVREGLRLLRNMTSSWPLVVEWHSRLSSLVKVLQDRAMGLDEQATYDPPFEDLRLQYGHVRAQTPKTPFGAPAADMLGSKVAQAERGSEYTSPMDSLTPTFRHFDPRLWT